MHSPFRTVYQRLFPYIDQVIARRPQQPVVELSNLFTNGVTYKNPKIREDSDGKVEMEVEISVPAITRPLRFKGLGNNKKQAKYAAAKCALRELRKRLKNN